MADERYQSAYTGTQIDTAIGRIVNKELDKMVAEATNAADAAQSALSGVNTAINNIPSGSTPIVNDLTTGGTTSALSAEQGKVLGRRSNRNLIRNWYLKDPVNQLGQTEYATAGYGLDMWKSQNAATVVSLDSNGMTITNTSASSTTFVRQYFEEQHGFVGKQMTLSVLFSDGTLMSKTADAVEKGTGGYKYNCTLNVSGDSAIYIALGVNENETAAIAIRIAAGLSVSIAAIKLEYGSVQTLAHQEDNGAWVLNDFYDKGEELAKCQRYRLVANQVIASGYLTQTKSELRAMIPVPVTMRTTPSIADYKISGVRLGAGGTSTNPTVTDAIVYAFASNSVMVTFKTATYADDGSVPNNTPFGCLVEKIVFDAYPY